MANENPSRESQSRQQSGERAQTGSQQGSYGQGTSGQGTGTSTWQGGRQQPGALQPRRDSQSMAPYSGYSPGYGGGPFSMMRRISDEMDRLFETVGLGRGLFPEARQGGPWDVGAFGEGAPSMWSPHVEVCERNGKLLIQADLPGMKRDDVNVRVEQDQVIIQGERRQDESSTQGGYYRSERSYGSFYRSIPLPEGTNPDSATASFRDGVLEIELEAPRQQERGRTLEIREGATGASAQGGTRAGTGSGTTYGSGTTGSTGGTQQSASGSGGSQQSASGSSGSQYSGSTSSRSQQSASGTMGSQQSSGTSRGSRRS